MLNTHHHGDHTHGNGYFPEATIICHEETRRLTIGQEPPPNGLIWEPVDWGTVPATPRIPHLPRRRGRVGRRPSGRGASHRHPGAHDERPIAWLPEERVLFSGDLVFASGTPFFLMGSLAGSLEALDRLRALAPRVIVPGQGNVCGPEVFDRIEGYLRFVQGLAEQAHAARLSPLDASREADLGEYAEWLDAERIVGNLHRAYLELDGQPRGTPVDLVAALGDMVRFNGGRPLRWHA